MRKHWLALLCSISLSACSGLPDGIEPVTGFELDRYLGTWYEIARLDHRFERGLSHVTATYSMRDDGQVRVLNRGYSERKGEWRDTTGRAYFMGEPSVGQLKVVFFGIFGSPYVIFELDQESYQYAFVTSDNRGVLWLLARTPQISDALKAHFVERTTELGFDTAALIWVEHASSKVE